MLKRIVLILLLSAAVSQVRAEDVPIELDLNKSNHVNVTPLAQGGYRIETTGGDPYLMSKPLTQQYDPDKQYILSFGYFCDKGLAPIQLHYGPPISARQMAEGPSLLSSEGWTSYSMNIKTCQNPDTWRGGHKLFRLDLGRTAGRTISIRDIRLRAPNAYEKQKAYQAAARLKKIAEFESQIKNTVTAVHKERIERVEATAEKILITINAVAAKNDLLLCEVPIYQTIVGRSEFVWKKPVPKKNGKQTIKVDRIRGGHDRIFSSWILMRKTAAGLKPASHQRFAETIPSKWKLTRDRPLSKKGTTGINPGYKVQFDDYKELGIHNCTKNIVLNHLVAPKAAKDTLPHKFNETTIHIRKNALANYDKSMLMMEELKIVVSAIILIHKNSPMAHPGCTPEGKYAMANVVQREGWNQYAAALDFLAQRYTRPDRKYGRITHWILHNEVDAGWIWTNAGEIPMRTYLDLHYRSMRTAQGVLRRYGDAGDVLISLTHYWTDAHNARCYAPKEMLDLFAKRSWQEGDFDWGLAYHPYPQNLRDPRTWLDTKATFDFQTKLITPKNLEVLDAYMRQEQMLYDGKVRTIVLSEQGSNSPDYSEKSLRDQAAGLVYTWLKFEKIDSFESYVHHRWLDSLNEGGLLLGFWTNNPDKTPRYSKKPSWDIYRQLGTEEQSKTVDWLKTVIDEKYLGDIPYKGTIRR